MMAVHAAMLLKVEQDKELGRQQAAKLTATTLAQMEQILGVVKEQNAKLIAELADTHTGIIGVRC